jgi:hypothetical protein
MHPSNRVTPENLKDVVYWHKPTPEKAQKYEKIADACYMLMDIILQNAPDSADRSAALRAVREARMWANSSIALDQGEIDHTRGVP